MKKGTQYIILLIFVLSSCVTQIRDFEQIESNYFLTVEGSLSNQEGPHRVLVSYSSPNINQNIENKPIENALVFITDNKDGRIDLTEIAEGIYETPSDYKGIVGNSYQLHISLPSGKEYESTLEKLLPPTKIDKVNQNFVVKTNYPLTDIRSVGFDITLNFKDAPEPNQYYQWKWKHYERTVYCATCERGYDYFLKKCSKFNNFQTGQTFPEIINYPCYDSCFDIVFSSNYNIFSDNLLNGQSITNYPITRVPFNSGSIYYLVIEQRSISAKMYRYFRSIKEVTQNSGTLFDVPAQTQFSPNIISLDNPDEKILGAFEVFGSDEKIVYVDRTEGTQNYSPVRVRYPGRVLPGSRPPTAYCIEGRYRTKTEPKDFRE